MDQEPLESKQVITLEHNTSLPPEVSLENIGSPISISGNSWMLGFSIKEKAQLQTEGLCVLNIRRVTSGASSAPLLRL